jgi:integrase
MSLQFLWHTGGRISETTNIKISDIDFENNYVIIPNKIYKNQQESLLKEVINNFEVNNFR